ncbi:MAG: glycosyltransferase family 2 protein [Bacteroidetes bacterium]|nr:glycosyltransferase family 2 protein [Bacteroidota bacterium]
MNKPFFSIIIPTYNRSSLILKTLDSVFSQTYPDYEVIVVDNCSTDTTAEILKPLHDSGKIIFIQHDKNYERAVSRNTGIKNAKGAFLTFLDSDDTMHPDHLSTLFSIIKTNPEINFLATKYNIKRNNKIFYPSSLAGVKEGWHGIELLLKGNPLAISFCIKKNNSELHLFNEDSKYTVVEDWMFLMQNLMKEKIYIADKITITLNDHDERTMRGNNQDIISKKLLAVEWIKQNLPLSNKQIRIVEGYSFYFCAIHNYIDENRIYAIKYLIKTTAKIGININLIILFFKILIGNNIIRKLK